MRKLPRFFVVARHFQQTLRVAHIRAMLGQLGRGHLRGLGILQPCASRLCRFVRFDARRTEHYDGIPDPLSLELYERVDILPEDADRPGRRALQKLLVFVGRFRCVLRFQFSAVGHRSLLPLRRTLIVGIAAAGGNVFR